MVKISSEIKSIFKEKRLNIDVLDAALSTI